MRPSSALRELMGKRDFYAGGLMVLLGLGIAIKGATYRAGTLMHMGPGFLPTALGVLLALLGIAIAAAGLTPSEGGSADDQRILPESPQWWAWFCILASPALFILFGLYFGMAPGTFACVFIAALGAKTVTFKSASILALVVTSFGVTLFVRFLQVPLPVFSSLIVEIISIFYAVGLLAYFVFRPLVASLVIALIIATVIPALYEVGLFFIPATSTFILAGALSYFAFRQAPPRLLASFIVEIIPPVFATANLFYLLFRLVLSIDGTTSFVLAVIVAVMFGLGLYFPPAILTPATRPAGPEHQRVRQVGETLLPLAPACVFAVLSVLFRVLWQQYPQSPLSIVAAMLPPMLLAAGTMLWSALYFPPATATAATESAGTRTRLARRAANPLPFALACIIVVLAAFSVPLAFLFADNGLTSLLVTIIVAAMFGAGVIFAPGTWTVAMDPAATGDRRLFRGGERFLPYLLALVAAVLAVEVSVYLDLFSGLQRGVP